MNEAPLYLLGQVLGFRAMDTKKGSSKQFVLHRDTDRALRDGIVHLLIRSAMRAMDLHNPTCASARVMISTGFTGTSMMTSGR